MNYIQSIDQKALEYFHSINCPFLDQIMIFITGLGSFYIIATLGIVFALYFYRRERIKSYLLVLTIALSEILVRLIKHTLQKERPPVETLIDANGYSFPSGHTTNAVAFYIILLIFLKKYIPTKHQPVFTTFLILLALLVGFSRIYLKVHWFSDYIGGITLGIIIVLIVNSIYIKLHPRKKER